MKSSQKKKSRIYLKRRKKVHVFFNFWLSFWFLKRKWLKTHIHVTDSEEKINKSWSYENKKTTMLLKATKIRRVHKRDYVIFVLFLWHYETNKTQLRYNSKHVGKWQIYITVFQSRDILFFQYFDIFFRVW
jgi:hypothetical protein